jgi:hypothetical protein
VNQDCIPLRQREAEREKTGAISGVSWPASLRFRYLKGNIRASQNTIISLSCPR